MVTEAMKLDDCLLAENLTNLDSVTKQRHHFADKDMYSQGYEVFPAIMYGCESWTIRQAETEELMLSNCGAGEGS